MHNPLFRMEKFIHSSWKIDFPQTVNILSHTYINKGLHTFPQCRMLRIFLFSYLVHKIKL